MKIKLENKIEAILFLESDPVEISVLAKELKIEKKVCRQRIKNLKKRHQESDSSLTLAINKNQIQLVTKKELADFLKKYFKKSCNSEQLSPAMLEVLSVVIYKCPINKFEIEQIRGVNCDLILRKLSIRGLIDKRKSAENSKSFIYEPSLKLLKKMGIAQLEDLPDYDKLSKELEK